MGHLTATNHIKPQNLTGCFDFAFMQFEIAFFIGLKNPNKTTPSCVFSDKSDFECPISVPFATFFQKMKHHSLGNHNLSQGISNHLLSFLLEFAKLVPFLKGDV